MSRRRRRRNKNPYAGPNAIPEGLVAPADFDLESILNDVDSEPVASEPKPSAPTPAVTKPLKVEDVVPPSFFVLNEIDQGEFHKYQFTLWVNKASVSMKGRSRADRYPEITFNVTLGMTHYYMMGSDEESKRPQLLYAPLAEPFDIKIPATFLPKTIREAPEELSLKSAGALLIQMFNQMKWEVIRPAPKADIEHMVPNAILDKIGYNREEKPWA